MLFGIGTEAIDSDLDRNFVLDNFLYNASVDIWINLERRIHLLLRYSAAARVVFSLYFFQTIRLCSPM